MRQQQLAIITEEWRDGYRCPYYNRSLEEIEGLVDLSTYRPKLELEAPVAAGHKMPQNPHIINVDWAGWAPSPRWHRLYIPITWLHAFHRGSWELGMEHIYLHRNLNFRFLCLVNK